MRGNPIREQEGEGYNVNVAWNGASMGDAEYLAAFHHVLMPIAYEVGMYHTTPCYTPSHPHTPTPSHPQYNPELVIISCGFDAARGDPLGHYDITPSGYAHMTHLLTSLAEGKVVIALEVHVFSFWLSCKCITFMFSR